MGDYIAARMVQVIIVVLTTAVMIDLVVTGPY